MEAYIRGLIPNLAQLCDMPNAFMQMYCRIAAHKFFFLCDPNRRGWPTFLFYTFINSFLIFSAFLYSFSFIMKYIDFFKNIDVYTHVEANQLFATIFSEKGIM